MSYIASFDIGTTNTKGVLVSPEGAIHHEKNISMTTMQNGNYVEQDPKQWLQAVIDIANEWFQQGITADEILVITLSGQMQDCIPIDREGEPVRPAILYADGRATKQAEQMKDKWGSTTIQSKTGNHMNGSLTFPKIKWLQEEEAELFLHTDCILMSSKDYVIRHLTGNKMTDPTTAATAGLMDIHKWQWMGDWLADMGIAEALLPNIVRSDHTAGRVTPEAAMKTGFAVGTPVLCGIGDAGAATIGANVGKLGEIYAYIGTSGWMATITDQVQFLPAGVFHLAYVQENQYIVTPPITNAGIVHKWVRSVFADELVDDQAAYGQLENLMQAVDPKQNHLLFLPYLQGERFPVQDQSATGIYIGLKSSTTKAEMIYAALEGVAMAMRQGMEQIAPQQTFHQLTLIGGGSKSEIWNQIFADILNLQVCVPADSQFLPSKGAAALGAIYLGWCQELREFITTSITSQHIYHPNAALETHVEQKYKRYLRLYAACKELF